jgi:hypothetical protein
LHIVSLEKDTPLSREEISEIALSLYGPGKKWYSELARDLLAEKRSELMLRAARLQSWIVEIEDNRISPNSRRMLMKNDS